jgi:hypothetical protein
MATLAIGMPKKNIIIHYEHLKSIITQLVPSDLNTLIYDIVIKIIDLPLKTDASIADLINYNPQETNIEPLKQGQIYNLVINVCKTININLINVDDSIGGLAYYSKFKKITNYKDTL